MTYQQLEKYLWGAATQLRGAIDAGDYMEKPVLQTTLRRFKPTTVDI